MLQLMNLSPPKFLKRLQKSPHPYFFHGAFAPSFIWCRRPCHQILFLDCKCAIIAVAVARTPDLTALPVPT